MDAYHKLANGLKSAGVTTSNMFGMPVLKIGKKPFAGFVTDGVNFKLPAEGEAMKKALALPGAHLFQPQMHGTKGPLMKQWVVVPFIHSEKYLDIAAASIAFVEAELAREVTGVAD